MTIVIAAGGTGGHLYPAVALAREFTRHDPTSKVLFVGTSRGLESKVLAHEGFELVLIEAQPVMGIGLWRMMKGLCAIPITLWQCLQIVRRYRVHLVIGVGGYTSPMMVMAAALTGVTRVILEPNANPGLANKAVAPFAQRVFLAFESAAAAFDRKKVRVVGTPIRREFLARPEKTGGQEKESGLLHLLIFGGSQGAMAINSAAMEAIPVVMKRHPRILITHQTGEQDYARVSESYKKAEVPVTVTPFLYDMPAAINEADLIVARAGAMTVAELTTCGKPAILIPLPTAIYDHQMKNAKVMEAAGAAVVIPQSELTGAKLAETVVTILDDPQRVMAMGAASMTLRRTDAAETIVRECYVLMGDHHDYNQPLGETGA